MVKSINDGCESSTIERIHKLSTESIEVDDNFINKLKFEYLVEDPKNEKIITRMSSDIANIIISTSVDTRDVFTFRLIGDEHNDKSSVSLWDVMKIFGIKLGYRQHIVALKQCMYNFIYAIETERGYFFGAIDPDDGSHSDIEVKNDHSVINDKKVTKKLQETETSETIRKKVPASEITLVDSSSDSSVKVAYYLSSKGTPKFTFYLTDYKSLEEGQWINDLIIDWYLTYLYEKVISEENRKRTYIYSSLFFAIMRNDVSYVTGSLQGLDENYSRVRRFIKDDVNIFDKDFIIMPVNEDNRHWYLMIICYPGLVITDQVSNTSRSLEKLDLSNNKRKYIKQPSILILDSLSTTRKFEDANKIRGYLSFEYSRQFKKKLLFSDRVMKCYYPKIPMQQNSSDCGMFVLQYVESFFKNPKIENVLSGKAKKWFDSTTIIKKRVKIVRMLQKMSKETIGQNTTVNLPKLNFPSLKKTINDFNKDLNDDTDDEGEKIYRKPVVNKRHEESKIKDAELVSIVSDNENKRNISDNEMIISNVSNSSDSDLF